MRRLVPVWAVVVLAGCQTYDFERVTPLTVGQTTQHTLSANKRLKPNIMLLVDNSGSMLLPTDDTDPRCAAGCGTSAATKCAASCPTRVSEMKAAMGDFLAQQGALGRIGLTVFPQPVNGESCKAASNVNAPLAAPTRNDDGTDASLRSASAAVNELLQRYPDPNGGTPTGASLAFVGTVSGLSDPNDAREDFVVLLTDGLPNCRDANPVNVCDCGDTCSTARIAACACTQQSCTGAARCHIACLDQGGAVENVAALKAKGLRTIVVGFGAEVSRGKGPEVLNAMAEVGGFARACPGGTSAECGGGACDASTFTCAQRFFSARNAGELTAALARISEVINPRPCEFVLEARPSDPRYLAVVIDGKPVPAADDTWRYEHATQVVTFQGALCQRLENSTPQAPVDVVFRIVETL